MAVVGKMNKDTTMNMLMERKRIVSVGEIARGEGSGIVSDRHDQMKEAHVVSERGRVSAERERESEVSGEQ